MTEPDKDSDFFIGWADPTPDVDRRFFVRAGLGLTALAGGLGLGWAAFQASPGSGRWD